MTPPRILGRQATAGCGVSSASADAKATHHLAAGPDGEPHSTEQKDELP